MSVFFLAALGGVLVAFIAHPFFVAISFRNRAILDTKDLVATFNKDGRNNNELIEKALNMIGNAYKIPIGKLRPEDVLNGPIAKIDSWRLGNGSEKISSYFAENSELSICLPKDASLADLVDILVEIEKHKHH